MASNVIYYFTGTGNSLFAARRIAKIIGETQLVHMTKQEDYILPDDLISIGLVFPVYIFGLPLIVERCIEKLKIYKNVYIYAVVTHGGIPSATLTQAEKELSKKGIRLSAGFEVLMIDNATMNADIITKEKQQKRIKDAEIKIESICKMIKDESNKYL
jgi:flavodoxin